MWNDFLYSLWFFLPAGIANVTPILVYKLPLLRKWNSPLDCGLQYKGKQIFGMNKTWRGFVCGVIAAELIFLWQRQIAVHIGSFSTYLMAMHYSQLPVLLGVMLGVGVIFGDALESFVKRQKAIEPGSSWFPYDQLDYIIGGCAVSLLAVVLPINIYVWILLTWFCMHLLFSYIGFKLHFKAKPI